MWTLFDNNFLYFIISFYIFNFIIYLLILINEFLISVPNHFEIKILFRKFYRFKIQFNRMEKFNEIKFSTLFINFTIDFMIYIYYMSYVNYYISIHLIQI